MAYRAPRWLLWGVIIACLLFVGLLIASTMPSLKIPRYGVWIGGVGVLAGLAGILEVVVGPIVLEARRGQAPHVIS